MIRLLLSMLAFTAMLTGVAGAQSGGPFAPQVLINGRAITNWEIDQRIRFMQLLKVPGNLEEEALKALIEDRLRMDAADKTGVDLTQEEIIEGMTEFAGRANLNLDQFIAAIGQEGVERETFYDFVEAGIAWRKLVNGRFGPRASITEDEVDRAVALTSRAGAARVLLSEIILRADTPEFAAESQELAQRLSDQIDSAEEFAAAARRYSVSNSAGRGGRIDWVDLAALPPAIAAEVLPLAPGEVSDPIPVPNAIGLFQLRAIEENDVAETDALTIEFAQFYFPDGKLAEAEKLTTRVDTCDDLYGAALKLPEERLQRQALPVADIPADLALALAKLDAGETQILSNDGQLSVLMLCGRTPILEVEIDRGQIRQRLRNQRLASYADGYMEELKAEAIILYP